MLTKTKISWLEWSEESFKKAKQQDKPILLGISAVWCHWCHVMDQTTYSDAEVARVIEENYVPIRVDRDQRPDIDKRYNMGGWPTTAFLTPDGDVLTGGTYIPPQQMLVMLAHISMVYRKEKESLKEKIREIRQQPHQVPHVECELDGEVFQSVIDGLTLHIASRFDSEYGGFGDAPKFPHSEALRLILLQHRLQGHEAALSIVEKTLTHMYRGGVYDQEEGGFFRYSTTKDWSIPHYEKMCEDNAKLLVTFLEMYQFTGEPVFKDATQGILGYVTSKLSDQQNGGFFGSQDADEVYYKHTLSERKSRTAPRIDQTLYVNWNGMMVSSFLLACVVLGESRYRDFTVKTVDLLLDKAFSQEKGISHYIVDGKSFLCGLLGDQVFMARCLLDCYQVCSDRRFLVKAESLARFMLCNLWDENSGFYDKPQNGEALGALKLRDKPLEENSVAAEVFLRLYYLTGSQRYFDVAKKTLDFFALNYQRYGVMGSVYGLAVEWFLHPMQIHVVGSKESELTNRLLEQSLKAYYPIKVVEVVDPDQNMQRLKKLGYQADGVPRAYVCFGGSCSLVEDPNKIGEHIRGKTDGNNS